MALKRPVCDADNFHLQNKRRHLLSNIFKGMSGVRKIDEFLPLLEPIIRKWVKEEVSRVVDPYLSRSLSTQTESSRSRSLHLQFDCSLPPTLFTNNKIVSEIRTPVKISLYDPTCQQIVTSGPYASMKVGVVVLQGDFPRDGGDHEWSQKEFESKIVLSREGKRPLLNGDMIVVLNNGVGYISNVSFTDNSSWDRSGRFRLGVRVYSGVDDATSVREGISNAFKVKDQRGESYQKQHPPSLNDEVWRLEMIAKDGAYHKRLTKLGISSVGDLLRSYAINKNSLRAELCKISNQKWDSILAHAAECIVDEKKYVCRTDQGTALLFDSIYSLIGVAFDGITYQSLDTLDAYQRKMVNDMKQHAFENLNNLRICEADTNIVPQHAYLHIEKGEVEMQINSHQKLETEDENRSFEIGESSEMQGFNFTFSNSFGVNDSPAGFYMAPQDFTVNDDFEVESSALEGNGLFLFRAN